MNLRRLAASTVVLWLAALLPIHGASLFDPDSAKGPFPVAGTLAGVAFEQVADGLGSVTAITHAGDSRLFVTIRDGRILIVENGAARAQPFLDIHTLITTVGEGGLLSTAFHPHYADNGFFFVNYTNTNGDTVIARYQVSGDANRADPASARTLLLITQPFSNHNGGQLQFGPDGYLYIGMGDGGSAFDPECRAQREDSLLGKMLRIDVDQNVGGSPFYGIPADNPFRGAGDPPDEIWSSGLRNPWRFSFDRQTGDLWIGDVGQNQREEIDFQPASSRGGENYGWKVMEGTLCSTRTACPASTPACDSPAFTPPVLEYDHASGCSVTGGYVYRGSRLPQLRGTYMFADFCTGVVWAATRQGSGFTVKRLAAPVSQIITFGEDRDGELYAGNLTGNLFRLTGSSATRAADRVGLYNPAASLFQLKDANTAGAGVKTVRFGPRRSNWIPLAGDWDGDGQDTVGFYDPTTATFRLKNSTPGGGSDVILQVSSPSSRALPVAGDWDGDGRDTVGLYDPATRTFRLKNSLSGSGFDVTFAFGPATAGLTPLAGDWNGDGRDGIGLFDPARSVFILKNAFEDTTADFEFSFGVVSRNPIPVAGDWNGDGKDGVGVYEPATAFFRLRNALSAGNPEVQFRFGPRRGGWKPVAGAW
ncbi:MAG: PQQ-dependent sugar dehydrogenase [Thermoanaerobaculia bacterium]